MTRCPSTDNALMQNRFLTAALFVGALTLFGARADAQGQVAEVSVTFWKPDPVLIFSTSAISGLSVAEVDLAEEFNIEDKRFIEYRAAVGRSHKFRFSYVNFDYDAEAQIERTFTFRGRTFTIGAPATTDINWKLTTLGYEWDIVSTDQGYFGVITEVALNQIDASIDSPVLTTAATTDVWAPVPTIGITGRVYAGSAVAITGEFSGFKLAYGDFDVKYIDFDVNGSVGSRNAGAMAGYRSVIADYHIDDDIGDLKMRGLYFGGYVRF